MMKQFLSGSNANGFTLVELTIVLVIVALLTGMMLGPLSAQKDLQNVRETQRQLADIGEALMGYAASHQAADGRPHLPCPDTTGDGFENRAGDNTCVDQQGRLPWTDIGVGHEDAWGNRFSYRVVKEYSNRGAGFVLGTAAALKVCEDSVCTVAIASNLPAVVVSHGKNGAGAFNALGGTNPAPVGADEISNRNASNNFVSHVPSSVTGSEFDDIVIWISPYILFNRMIAAGKLP
ncbi:MAG: type II secretion system GspH family protein [Candidatus Accumulibacter sp.]|jgi:prepilin-type N-terminal cleavage/methylation domain-containing protein|nr:type II secretion system GspH family protein [Accumulibacter sp.]